MKLWVMHLLKLKHITININRLYPKSKQTISHAVQDLKRDMQRLAPRVNILADIVKDVITAFGQKRSRNILDFADYEHFALQILTNDDGSPSHIAEMYREQFAEILVDEYQDTNRVQEQILSCIKTGSEADGNLL